MHLPEGKEPFTPPKGSTPVFPNPPFTPFDNTTPVLRSTSSFNPQIPATAPPSFFRDRANEPDMDLSLAISGLDLDLNHPSPLWSFSESTDKVSWSQGPAPVLWGASEGGPFGSNLRPHTSHRRKKCENATRFAHSTVQDFRGRLITLCKDQHGCRFLQKQLELRDEVIPTLIFNETYLHAVELMTDPFGNYLIQKLFQNISNDQRLVMVKNLAPHLVSTALDPHGTRALQKLIECISTPEEVQVLFNSFSGHEVLLCKDLNGNHVIQKCLEKLDPHSCQSIFYAATNNCMEIATHRHGCCVLQRCLDHGSPLQRRQLSYQVAKNMHTLSFDPFGNYVVQYVLTLALDEQISAEILKSVTKLIIPLSLHKFGSNVVEKMIKVPSLSSKLIEELLVNHSSNDLERLLHDPYGNYVLQTSLDSSSQQQFERLSERLAPLLPKVKNTPHGRRIAARLQHRSRIL